MKRVVLVFLLGAASLLAQESAGGAETGDNNILWKWANFAILAVGLGYVIAKNAPAAFRARTSEIQKGIAEAQAIKKDAETRAAEVDAKLARLSADIELFRTQAKAEMETEGARIRKETTAQIQRVQQQAAAEIESAGKTARRELREYEAQLALDLAAEHLRQRITPAEDAALISDFVNSLDSYQAGHSAAHG